MAAEISDHFDGRVFFNPSRRSHKKFKDLVHWRRTRRPIPWPRWVDNLLTPSLPASVRPHQVAFTYLGHDTFLIQTAAANLLTDPIFSMRASPFPFAGPRRVRLPALALSKLPEIHIVLVSHNHYDHMDIPSLKALDRRFQPTFVVPLRNSGYLRKAGIQNIRELDWWESMHEKVTISLAPAEHWSARGLWDRNKALWGSFWITYDTHKIYHAGDTGYGNHFSKIREKWGSPTVSLLPIGAYEPRWFMKEQHMNPKDAIQAHRDLQSGHSIAMHFGTFPLTDEGIDEPIFHLKEALIKEKNTDNFSTLDFGETWVSESD